MLKLEGHRFGRLEVIARVPGTAWLCKCDCGKTAVVTTSNLRGGNSQSCGCARHESNRTHGMSGSQEYRTWKSMHSRCKCKHPVTRRNYLDRGIKPCSEWSDFTIFLRDMGKHPGKGFELDRIDNDKGYSKDNCRWITTRGNRINRRSTHWLEFDGKKQTIADWSLEIGINPRTLSNRLLRGWTVEEALTEPSATKGKIHGLRSIYS